MRPPPGSGRPLVKGGCEHCNGLIDCFELGVTASGCLQCGVERRHQHVGASACSCMPSTVLLVPALHAYAQAGHAFWRIEISRTPGTARRTAESRQALQPAAGPPDAPGGRREGGRCHPGAVGPQRCLWPFKLTLFNPHLTLCTGRHSRPNRGGRFGSKSQAESASPAPLAARGASPWCFRWVNMTLNFVFTRAPGCVGAGGVRSRRKPLPRCGQRGWARKQAVVDTAFEAGLLQQKSLACPHRSGAIAFHGPQGCTNVLRLMNAGAAEPVCPGSARLRSSSAACSDLMNKAIVRVAALMVGKVPGSTLQLTATWVRARMCVQKSWGCSPPCKPT